MGDVLSSPEAFESQSPNDSNPQDNGLDASQEAVLLAHLVKLLNSRPGHSLLLSDLGALLSGGVRQRVKDQGGLRSWLQRYSNLFSVVGQPGKESVSLCIGVSPSQDFQGVAMARAEDASNDAVNGTVTMLGDAERETLEAVSLEEDIEAQSAVQLRGLPYRATVADIQAFLGEHAAQLADSNAIQLVQNRDGRPSGFARVQFSLPEHAKKCVSDLHLRSMDDRYVEVFLYSERPSKGRQRRGGHEDGVAVSGEQARMPIDTFGVTRDDVVRECRMQMADITKRKQLLSMLGVALSPGARSYLKQMDQGLKHFLSQFPNEFSVDGGKGCEYVTFTPTHISLSEQLNLSEVLDVYEPHEPASVVAGQTTASFSADDKALTSSPKPMKPPTTDNTPGPASANRGSFATPSDWGTPHPQAWPQQTSTPWLPPWPGPAPASSMGGEASSWNQLPAWPPTTPQSQFWSGWPSAYPGPSWASSPPPPVEANSDVTAPQQSSTEANTSTAPSAPTRGSGTTSSSIRLRGLPFTSVEQDVLAFFAQHDIVDRVADGPNAVTIMTRSNGRPSGQAVIQMREPADAEIASQVLHGQYMGTRYIEVFLLYSEEEAGKNAGEKKAEEQEATSGTAPPSTTTSAPPTQFQTAPASVASLSGPPDLSNPFAAMPGMTPGLPAPWQLGLWNGMANNNAPPSLGTSDFGSSEPSSWDALFEFLGPEVAAHHAAQMLAASGNMPPVDYSLPPGFPGLGMPPPAPSGFPPGSSES